MSAKLLSEGIGTAALLAIVVGSGIMGESLAAGNAAVALLANSLATGAGLYVLITLLGPISGAHLNPWVSLVMWHQGELSTRELPAFIAAQTVGAIVGVWLAHWMFGLPIFETATKTRDSVGQWTGELIATAGLLSVILLARRLRAETTAALVGSYIIAAYWFTSSTSFANAAVTIARALTNSFAGIRPADVPAFIIAQMAGAILVLIAMRILRREPACDVTNTPVDFTP